MRRHRLSAWCGVVFAVSMAPLARCYDDDGGDNLNERTPGNGDDGVLLWNGEIAIDPTGHYLVATLDGRLIHGDLSNGTTRALPRLDGTTRLAFDHAGTSVFVSRVELEEEAEAVARRGGAIQIGARTNGSRLVRYDLSAGKELWSRPVEIARTLDNRYRPENYPFLDVTDDDKRLVVSEAGQVSVLAADSGKQLLTTGRLPRRVVDVDLTRDQQHAVITLAHAWPDAEHPETRVQIRDLKTFALHEVVVPNCSSELAVMPDGKRAFLAPPTCEHTRADDNFDEPAPPTGKRRDPVSVIDLEQHAFIRNLPGFGPVALVQGGDLAVAFMDRETLDEALFDHPEQIPREGPRYRLMLIDTETLEFETLELGDDVPRYALTPDGQLLLVDAPSLWLDGRIRILDTVTRELTQLSGPGLRLDNYVMTRDSSQAFLLDRGLFRISLAERRAVAEPIMFTPTRINITPDDRQLVLRESEEVLWLYDIESSELKQSFKLER